MVAGWFIWQMLRGMKQKPATLDLPLTAPELAAIAKKQNPAVRGPWLFRVFVWLLVAVACVGAVGLAGTVLWLLAYVVGYF